MGARPRTLAADEIAVRGRGAALARRDEVAIHADARRATGMAPFEAGLGEDAVETFRLRLALHQAGARHDHRLHRFRHLAAPGDLGGEAEILDPAVGAGAD